VLFARNAGRTRTAERRETHGLPPIDGRNTVIDAKWTYIRSGLAHGEKPIVDAIRASQQTARRLGSV
jgi:hypothetical protein